MTDILGPGSNTTDATTSRPADTREMGAADTYFQDCSSSSADDGTAINASFLNGVLANLRGLIRGNGNLGSGSPIVTENNGDTMLLLAVQNMIQRGKLLIASDAGSVNALVASMSVLTPAELVDGMIIVIKPVASNTGGATLTLVGTHSIITSGGAALSGGELQSSLWTMMQWNATWGAWQIVGSSGTGAGEGLQKSGSSLALNYPGLTQVNAIVDTDIISFFANALGHHVKTTFATLVAFLLNYFPAIPTSGASVSSTLATTYDQSFSDNVYTTINFSGSVPFGSVSYGVITLSKSGIYAVSVGMQIHTEQSSGQIQYSVTHIHAGGNSAIQGGIYAPSNGSVDAPLNATGVYFLNAGDTISADIYSHSSNNDSTNDYVYTGATLSIVKIM